MPRPATLRHAELFESWAALTKSRLSRAAVRCYQLAAELAAQVGDRVLMEAPSRLAALVRACHHSSFGSQFFHRQRSISSAAQRTIGRRRGRAELVSIVADLVGLDHGAMMEVLGATIVNVSLRKWPATSATFESAGRTGASIERRDHHDVLHVDLRRRNYSSSRSAVHPSPFLRHRSAWANSLLAPCAGAGGAASTMARCVDLRAKAGNGTGDFHSRHHRRPRQATSATSPISTL